MQPVGDRQSESLHQLDSYITRSADERNLDVRAQLHRLQVELRALLLQLDGCLLDVVHLEPEVVQPQVRVNWPRWHALVCRRDEYRQTVDVQVDARLPVRLNRLDDLRPEHRLEVLRRLHRGEAAQVNMVVGVCRHRCYPPRLFCYLRSATALYQQH